MKAEIAFRNLPLMNLYSTPISKILLTLLFVIGLSACTTPTYIVRSNGATTPPPPNQSDPTIATTPAPNQTIIVTNPRTTDKVRNNAVQIYPFSLIYSTMRVSYERRVRPRQSIVITGGLGTADNSNFYRAELFTELSLSLTYRFYLYNNTQEISGFWMAPQIGYKFGDFRAFRQEVDPVTGRIIREGVFSFQAAALSVNYLLGYQVVAKGGFTICPFLGGGLNLPDGSNLLVHPQNGRYVINSYDRGINPIAGLSIGVAF